MNKKNIPILDNGHGGLIDGVYQTAGKRSPDWRHGVLYEGVSNREFVQAVSLKLIDLKIPFYNICPEDQDITLKERVERTNKIHKQLPNSYLLSFHSNAGGGTGFEFFTSPGITQSDHLVLRLFNFFKAEFGNCTKFRKDLSDGFPDKEAAFYMLTKSNCRAILLELLFMDHKEDYERLFDKVYRARIVDTIVKFIVAEYEKT